MALKPFVYHRIDDLTCQAMRAIAYRGHGSMRPVGPQFATDTTRTWACPDCGMEVTVNTKPAANEIEIGGPAVAVNCGGDA